LARREARGPGDGKRSERFEREARALRANLRRRKEQARRQASTTVRERSASDTERKSDG